MQCAAKSVPEAEEVRIVIIKMFMVLIMKCYADHRTGETRGAIGEVLKTGMTDLTVDVTPKPMKTLVEKLIRSSNFMTRR